MQLHNGLDSVSENEASHHWASEERLKPSSISVRLSFPHKAWEQGDVSHVLLNEETKGLRVS